MTAGQAGQGRAQGAGAAEPPASGDGDDVLALAHPDWLYHHLTVTGDADLDTIRDVVAELDLSLHKLTNRLTSLDDVFTRRA